MCSKHLKTAWIVQALEPRLRLLPVCQIVPKNQFLQSFSDRSPAPDPSQLMADARSAATYCTSQMHALWDCPPAEALVCLTFCARISISLPVRQDWGQMTSLCSLTASCGFLTTCDRHLGQILFSGLHFVVSLLLCHFVHLMPGEL